MSPPRVHRTQCTFGRRSTQNSRKKYRNSGTGPRDAPSADVCLPAHWTSASACADTCSAPVLVTQATVDAERDRIHFVWSLPRKSKRLTRQQQQQQSSTRCLRCRCSRLRPPCASAAPRASAVPSGRVEAPAQRTHQYGCVTVQCLDAWRLTLELVFVGARSMPPASLIRKRTSLNPRECILHDHFKELGRT